MLPDLDTLGAPAPLRADAERNRRRLLDAARTVFGEHGLDASVAEIARSAGVGQGTVFRRFPTKDHLVLAVVADSIDQLRCVAEAQLDEPDAWKAIATFVERAVELHLHDRGLYDAVVAGRCPLDSLMDHKVALLAVVDQLVERAQAAGVVRADAAGSDLPMLAQFATQVGARYRDVQPELWRRYLAIALDGLRPGAPEPLPVAAPTPELLHDGCAAD